MKLYFGDHYQILKSILLQQKLPDFLHGCGYDDFALFHVAFSFFLLLLFGTLFRILRSRFHVLKRLEVLVMDSSP